MRSARLWLKVLLGRALGGTPLDHHSHPPQLPSPGLDALVATPSGPRIVRRV